MAQKFSNAARAELSAPLSSGDTSLTLLSGGELFPVANTGTNAISNSYDWFKVVVQDSYGYEIMYVRTHALNGLVLSNILRAQENTTALYFEAGTTVGLRPTAGDMNESVNNRVEKIAGKGLSTEDFTSAEKTKLSGIASNANNYSHPESHPASVIEQDANNRFVTDADKTAWNAKQAALVSGTSIKTLGGVSLLGSGDVALGTASAKDIGTSGGAVPLLNAANTWSADQVINANLGVGTAPLVPLHTKSDNAGTPTTTGTAMTGVSARIQNSSVGVDIGTYSNGTSFIQPRLAFDHAVNYDLTLNPNGGVTKIGKALTLPLYAAGTSGTAKTINFSNGHIQKLELTANCTITLSAPATGIYKLLPLQDPTGGRTVTWAGGSGVVFVGSATAPAINTNANGWTFVSVFFDGSYYWVAASKVMA